VAVATVKVLVAVFIEETWENHASPFHPPAQCRSKWQKCWCL